MPRVCVRLGCGVELLNKRGRADFSRRRFCSRECRLADALERLHHRRAKRKPR